MPPKELESAEYVYGIAAPPESAVLITSISSTAATQVLLLMLATDLHMNHDFWVNPIPALPPFSVYLRPDLPPATLAALRAAVGALPGAVMT